MLQQLARALSYVMHVESLLALAALALLLGIIEHIATLPGRLVVPAAFLARGIGSIYFFLVLHKAAAGRQRLPRLRDYRDTWDTLIHPLIRGAVAGLWYWGPVAWYGHRSVGLIDFTQRMQLRSIDLFRQPRRWGIGILTCELVYLPASLLGTTFSSRAVPLLDPTYALRRLSRVARAYALAFAALQPLVVTSFVMATCGSLLQQSLPVPLAAPVISHLMVLWIPLAQARLLGTFAAAHAEVFEEGRAPISQRPG